MMSLFELLPWDSIRPAHRRRSSSRRPRRNDPREGDGRPGLRSKNRGVAEVGALDHDIGLRLTLQVGVGRADDRARDRVVGLNRPMRAVLGLPRLWQPADRAVETARFEDPAHAARGSRRWCEHEKTKYEHRTNQPRCCRRARNRHAAHPALTKTPHCQSPFCPLQTDKSTKPAEKYVPRVSP